MTTERICQFRFLIRKTVLNTVAHNRVNLRNPRMSRNTLPIVIAVLAVGAAILGYMYYQDQQTSGVEIKIGESGISVEGK